MRIFISIELPDGIKKNIEKLIGEFKMNLTPIKWVESKNLHVTLKFLGWVDDKKLDNICNLVSTSLKGVGSFDIRIEGMGAFPTTKRPRVLWVGISKGAEVLAKISSSLEDVLSKEGFREEEREFSSHITIGRIKDKIDTEMLERHVNKDENISLGEFKADHISVMKSTLTQKGPIYEELKRVGLK